jgi:hypothetical protein
MITANIRKSDGKPASKKCSELFKITIYSSSCVSEVFQLDLNKKMHLTVEQSRRRAIEWKAAPEAEVMAVQLNNRD